jgi:Predicted dehydrogenases and related proteins
MIQAALDSGAKLIAFEKPVALTSAEVLSIRDMIRKAGAKAVVSHQHRYGKHYQKVKEIVASGALGRVHTVYGTATGWMTHMLSHMIDYSMWYNGYAPGVWAMAQAAGRAKFGDNHPSPDYIAGFVQFANGVRGIYECGAGAPDQPEVAKWWGKNRIGAQGTEGFAEVLTNGGWRAVTKSGGAQSGDGAMNYDADMPPYIQENGELAERRPEGSPMQPRTRLPRCGSHAGDAALRLRRRPDRPAAHDRRRRTGHAQGEGDGPPGAGFLRAKQEGIRIGVRARIQAHLARPPMGGLSCST